MIVHENQLIVEAVTNEHSRMFLLAAIYIPSLVWILARFPFTYGVIAAIIIFMVAVKLAGSGTKGRNSLMMGTFLWSHCYSIAIYKARVLPCKNEHRRSSF
jgi:hypothetical protein